MSHNATSSSVANNSSNVNDITSNNGNPFMALPRLLSAPPQDADDAPLEDQLEPAREPLEMEQINVESNAYVVEMKYTISDQKKARVDRILAESGTIMLSASANASGADASTPGPSTPAGGDGPSQSKGSS